MCIRDRSDAELREANLNLANLRGAIMNQAILTGANLRDAITVSYTHLDVYKRQPPRPR